MDDSLGWGLRGLTSGFLVGAIGGACLGIRSLTPAGATTEAVRYRLKRLGFALGVSGFCIAAFSWLMAGVMLAWTGR